MTQTQGGVYLSQEQYDKLRSEAIGNEYKAYYHEGNASNVQVNNPPVGPQPVEPPYQRSRSLIEDVGRVLLVRTLLGSPYGYGYGGYGYGGGLLNSYAYPSSYGYGSYGGYVPYAFSTGVGYTPTMNMNRSNRFSNGIYR